MQPRPSETMTAPTTQPRNVPTSRALDIFLWLVQGLLSVTFVGTAIWKALTPISTLATMIPWAGQVSPELLYATALFDLLGGLGILLPAITRIKPALTVAAALGCVALQVAAILFHFSRGEQANTPFNFVVIGLALFVAWGRHSRRPMPPR